MDLKEIMSVSGQSGLFKFVSQGRNGIIVEAFSDKKRIFVSASQKVSALSDIAIFTEGEEVPLKTVLKNIFDLNAGGPALDAKSSPEDLKKFLEKVLPDYDRNRVYISDIKKLVTWYNTLLGLDLLKFDDEEVAGEKPAEATEEVQTKAAAAKEKKEKAAPKAKKTSTTARKTKKD